MDKKVNDFLIYGMQGKIKKTEIYKMDGVVSFITFLALAVNEICGGFTLGRIGCISFLLSFIIFTFTRKDITGEKIFWIYGISSVEFCIFFGLIGTLLMLSTITKRNHMLYIGFIIFFYVIMLCLYVMLTCYLIKKDIYNSKSIKKMMGSWCFILFGICGISVTKILNMNTSQEKMIQIASIGSYLISIICLLGALNLVKYFWIKQIKKDYKRKE